jgi:hypothetical protein
VCFWKQPIRRLGIIPFPQSDEWSKCPAGDFSVTNAAIAANLDLQNCLATAVVFNDPNISVLQPGGFVGTKPGIGHE